MKLFVIHYMYHDSICLEKICNDKNTINIASENAKKKSCYLTTVGSYD